MPNTGDRNRGSSAIAPLRTMQLVGVAKGVIEAGGQHGFPSQPHSTNDFGFRNPSTTSAGCNCVSIEQCLRCETIEASPVSGAGSEPATVNGFAAKRALAILRSRDIDPSPLLRRARLSGYEPGEHRHRISALSQAQLVQYASETLKDTAFGLHLAQQTDPREAGLLFYAISAGNDVREALTLFARYARIANDAVRVAMVPRPTGTTLALTSFRIPRHSCRQNLEFAMAMIVKALREAAGRELNPGGARFSHARTTDLKEFNRFFNCVVEFSSQQDALDFEDQTLRLPLVTSDRYLLETLRPYCEEAATARRTSGGSFRARVENEIYRLLPHGRANVKTVAKFLGASPRTLARRLAEEKTSFAKILDELRQTLALQYVREANFTMAQIAWLLGYERPESFTHAFRRWSGRSPSDVRAKAEPAGSGAPSQNSGA
jgi:AraC-like DNA-binding protein